MPSTPPFSACQASYPGTSFEEDLSLLVELGVRGISIAEGKLRAGEEERQLEAFQASGLTAAVCLPSTSSALPSFPRMVRPGPENPRERIGLMQESIRRLAPFRPDTIVVATGSSRGYAPEEARALAVEGLRGAAAVADEYGLRLSLEPIRDVGYDASFVKTIPETLELIDEVGAENLDLCYDVYHLWDGDDIEALTETYASRIGGVQLNDWREPPRGMADRLMPGDGTIDLASLLAALVRGGYTGWYDLEIFSDDGRWGTDLPDSLWKLPAPEFYRRGRDAFARVWSSTTP